MVFSSITFIFYFLPLCLAIYYLVPRSYRNLVLFIASLGFYFVGEGPLVLLFLFSIIFHYLWAKVIVKYHNKPSLVIGIGFDLLLLGYFKYFNFFLDNLNHLTGLGINVARITLPIGISFFTFQGMSYLIDVYRQDVEAADSLVGFGTYLALFPQLIAGPIVRYEDVAKDIKSRNENSADFVKGIKRFIIGFGKKVIIADSMAIVIETMAAMTSKTVVSYWLEALAITMQLYFDFSAYSDMAIGLGLFFGFHFLENFNYPLFATSITDFWRKWHISLSSWFKDYVYIPLGGSRVGKYRHLFNIMLVWMLTGFWHGADWNFVLWGLYFGIILIIEKYFLKPFLDKHHLMAWFYSFVVVVVGFVIFHYSDLNALGNFLASAFGFGGLTFINTETLYYLESYLVLMLIAFLGASPLLKKCATKLELKYPQLSFYGQWLLLAVIFILTLSYLLGASFSPFLYFRF